jgi:hypothetical protein
MVLSVSIKTDLQKINPLILKNSKMKNTMFSQELSIRQLEEVRKGYKTLSWMNAYKNVTLITELTEEDLIQVMGAVAGHIATSNIFPGVDEFQNYNGVPYSTYRDALLNEYHYRELLQEELYNDYLDLEMLRQDKLDRDYYSNDY